MGVLAPAMCWVRLLDCKVLGTVWFEGKMTGQEYTWKATRNEYYFIQDEASSNKT